MSQEPKLNPPASTASRFKTVVAWVCGPIVLVELIALAIVTVWAAGILSKQKSSGPTYVSMARLMVGGGQANPKLANGEPMTVNYIGTLIELIQSNEVQKRALARVHAWHPDLEPQQFKIEAAEVGNTSIIMLRSTATNPAFAQVILDAVMDEFIAMQKINSGSGEATMIVIQDELVKLEKDMPLAEQRIKAAEQGGANPEQLIEPKARLQRMKMQCDRLMATLRNLDHDRPKGGAVFSILERASPAAVVVPTHPIFNHFKWQ